MDLSGHPRVLLGHFPTPLEHLPRLSQFIGGPEIYVKRDDCTGLAFGGNKTRKLEFLIADALRQNATTIVAMGTVQSNLPPLAAAAACKLGLKCELILEHRVAIDDVDYLDSGNPFLNKLYGANTHFVSDGADATSTMESVADEVRHRGEVPYVIPRGGSTPVGALGYVECASELLAQAKHENLSFDYIVHATASAGTQSGLLVGLKAMHCNTPVIGIGVNASKSVQTQRVLDLARKTAQYLGMPGLVSRDDVIANCDYVGAGYGLVASDMNAALMQVARLEGLLLDPVYSGKCMAGLIDLTRKGFFAGARNILFIHTGGSPALFGYRNQLNVR
ncbi:MAG: D-cysteine desulfhydrase [Proteobacteria bacterium]|nr:D-cysteine desulfhydrase [Pseudomonadota bacterium]